MNDKLWMINRFQQFKYFQAKKTIQKLNVNDRNGKISN